MNKFISDSFGPSICTFLLKTSGLNSVSWPSFVEFNKLLYLRAEMNATLLDGLFNFDIYKKFRTRFHSQHSLETLLLPFFYDALIISSIQFSLWHILCQFILSTCHSKSMEIMKRLKGSERHWKGVKGSERVKRTYKKSERTGKDKKTISVVILPLVWTLCCWISIKLLHSTNAWNRSVNRTRLPLDTILEIKHE